MFDTRGKIDPFAKDSEMRLDPIRAFPSSIFFVLRVTQLLRGLAANLDLNPDDFSTAAHWKKRAEAALREAGASPETPSLAEVLASKKIREWKLR